MFRSATDHHQGTQGGSLHTGITSPGSIDRKTTSQRYKATLPTSTDNTRSLA
jgi:hypothetical protein